MYQTLGFEDVGVVDIYFSEFMGPYRGFGMHRNICMVRQPGSAAGPVGSVETFPLMSRGWS